MRRDAPLGSDLPSLLTNSTTWNASIPLTSQVLSWQGLQGLPADTTWTGFSLLVDDVEQYTGNLTSFALRTLNPSIPHFFRLAVSDLSAKFRVTDIVLTVPSWRNQWGFLKGGSMVSKWNLGGSSTRRFIMFLLMLHLFLLGIIIGHKSTFNYQRKEFREPSKESDWYNPVVTTGKSP